MKKVTVRFATKDDAKELLSIYEPYVLETGITSECEVPSAKEFESRIQSISETFPYIVCEVDGEIAGYAYASLHKTRAGYRWDADASIYVSSKYHRNKIGTALYNCMLEIVKQQGFYVIYAVVTSTNEASVKFHEAFGFDYVGTYKNTIYKLGQWFDTRILEKQLKDYSIVPTETISVKEVDKDLIDRLFKEAEKLVAETFK